MDTPRILTPDSIRNDFRWLNEPPQWSLTSGKLHIVTARNTDFWQQTHYGFRRDDGHFFYTETDRDFLFAATFHFHPRVQYDQCGLMVRLDAENWLKCSVEYENSQSSRLGSVVTNHGWSDWATQDISSEIRVMTYRIRRRGQDFLIEYAPDAQIFTQMRICHLHNADATLAFGPYACSPQSEGFKCMAENLTLGQSPLAPQDTV